MRPNAAFWKEKLQLITHIEGGAFREVYRSPLIVPLKYLRSNAADTPGNQPFRGDRNFSTSIYFLLEKGGFSAFHRIASDELWHFYFGDSLLVYEINPLGLLTTHRLGSDVGNGEVFQTMIRAGSWFASCVAEGSDYSLVGCTVSPGFDFADFELADRQELSRQYPQHTALISTLTRV
jgi:predicted cupin superfamily sugar epimerase